VFNSELVSSCYVYVYAANIYLHVTIRSYMKHQHIEICWAHSLMYNYLLYFTNALKHAIFYLQRTLSISAPANVGPQP